MKKHIQKDYSRRIFVKKQEDQRITKKVILQNSSLATNIRLFNFNLLSKMKKNGSSVRINNRCVLTGRSRGVHRYFKISRIMIRQLAAQGLLPAVKKNSW